jgi:hypothetical protein
MMKYLKWFAFGSSCLGVAIFVPAFLSIDQPILAFCAAGGFATLTWFFWHLLPETNHYRQPMATAKSGGWEPPRNWNHRPDGMKRPEPPPGPPNRVDRAGVFIAQPTPEELYGFGFLNLPRTWHDAEDAAGAGLAWARQGAIQEKQDLDRRAKSLSNFIGLPEEFDRLDPVEQDLLRHQCEHMWRYSEVLGARIANWRDGGGK